MSETIIYQNDGGRATITLNRPESLNSVNGKLAYELKEALLRTSDDKDVRCLVITGGGRGFCAGADLGAGDINTPGDMRDVLQDRYNPIIKLIRDIEKPVISAVNGVAAGAGVSLALAADICIAAESASFVLAFVKIGLCPDAGISYFLPRLVGLKKAMEMALLGERFDAKTAERLGIINRSVPDDKLMQEVYALADRLAAGPYSQGLIKKLINSSADAQLGTALELETQAQVNAAGSLDFKEGVSAFMEKRKPNFIGR